MFSYTKVQNTLTQKNVFPLQLPTSQILGSSNLDGVWVLCYAIILPPSMEIYILHHESHTIVPLPFWHNLFFIQNLEKLFFICAKIGIKYKNSLLGFEPWTSKDSN
jgi:hypothetical protein